MFLNHHTHPTLGDQVSNNALSKTHLIVNQSVLYDCMQSSPSEKQKSNKNTQQNNKEKEKIPKDNQTQRIKGKKRSSSAHTNTQTT